MLQNNPELKSKIDQLWNKFWSGGISNPLTAIEQITYLLFQNQFADIVEKIEGLKIRHQQSLTDLEALYGALSQQALKGELDLSLVFLTAESER